jgi:hypothetical protein
MRAAHQLGAVRKSNKVVTFPVRREGQIVAILEYESMSVPTAALFIASTNDKQ